MKATLTMGDRAAALLLALDDLAKNAGWKDRVLIAQRFLEDVATVGSRQEEARAIADSIDLECSWCDCEGYFGHEPPPCSVCNRIRDGIFYAILNRS